jgi:hypothetical protein
MFLHFLLRQWRGLGVTGAPGATQTTPPPQGGPAAGSGTDPSPPTDDALCTQAELNALLSRLRDNENRLLASMQAVEQEMSAVLSEYAEARAGSSPEVERRLLRRYQRLELRRSGLNQVYAEQLQDYRLLDHVEAALMRRDLAGGTHEDTVLGLPLARLIDRLSQSVARSGHRSSLVRDTVEGLDAYRRDMTLTDDLGLAEVKAKMDALTEAEYQHAQDLALGEPEAWALASGTVAVPAGAGGAVASAEPAAPSASHWRAKPPDASSFIGKPSPRA